MARDSWESFDDIEEAVAEFESRANGVAPSHPYLHLLTFELGHPASPEADRGHVCTFGWFSDTPPAPSTGYFYGGISVTRWGENEHQSASDLLSEVAAGGLRIDGGDRVVHFSRKAGIQTRPRVPLEASPPLTVLCVSPEQKSDLPLWFHRPITGPDRPTYEDGGDFVRAESGIWDWHPAGGPDWHRGLLLFCPDLRGRIADVTVGEWLAGELLVQTESSQELIAEVRYRGRKKDGSVDYGRLRTFEQLDAGRLWRLPLSADWDALSIFAVIASGELVDRLPENAIEFFRSRSADRRSDAELLVMLESGEGEGLEFKSWRTLDRRKEGKLTLLKEIVALSNSSGGTLLLGVTDEGELDGPSETAPVVEVAAVVRDWVREELAPDVVIRQDVRTLQGRVLLVTEVHEAAVKPVSSRTGVFYLRDGAHSRPARRRDLLRLLGPT